MFLADAFYSCNTGSYLVQGDSSDPSINGPYVPNDQSHNGYPVYAHVNGNKFLFWASHAGGLWVIADTVSNTVSPEAKERDYDTDPELSQRSGGSTCEWLADMGRGMGPIRAIRVRWEILVVSMVFWWFLRCP